MAPPAAVELGPVGAPLGVSTAADIEAENHAGAGGGGRAAVVITAAPPVAKPRLGIGPVTRRRHRGLRRWRRRARAMPAYPPLLADESFRAFWLARLSTQAAQGALVYALLLVVADRTNAAFYNSLFVVSAILPSIIFGLPGGIVADSLPHRPLLIGLNLARFVFAFSLVIQDPALPGVFAASLGIWTIHQFHAPAESSTMAALVPRERYANAQALSNLALTLAQLLGLVILAPLLLKTVGPRALFAVCAAAFVVAAGYAALLPRLDAHLSDARRRTHPRSLRRALLNGWRGVRGDTVTYGALVDDVLVGIGMSALVVIMPLYLNRVLDTAAENTVFVFAPAALGLVLGLRIAPRIGHAVGEERVATAGLLLFAACVGALGFVESLRTFLNDVLHLPLSAIADVARIPSLVLIAMLVSVPAGFASALVSVSARTLILKRTDPALRGQVVATQSLLGNLGALAPTLLTGLAADLFGVIPVAVGIAVLLASGALAAHTVGRPAPIQAPVPSA